MEKLWTFIWIFYYYLHFCVFILWNHYFFVLLSFYSESIDCWMFYTVFYLIEWMRIKITFSHSNSFAPFLFQCLFIGNISFCIINLGHFVEGGKTSFTRFSWKHSISSTCIMCILGKMTYVSCSQNEIAFFFLGKRKNVKNLSKNN